MNLSGLTKRKQAKRVLGVDTSTHSLAFCLMEKRRNQWQPLHWGKMDIHGTAMDERLGDIVKKLGSVLEELQPDAVVIEGPVYINSKDVTIKISKIIGAATGIASAYGADCYEVAPTSWMNYIGNPTRDSAEFKKRLRDKNPGKAKTWYKAEARRMRKQRTMDWVKLTFGISLDDDDVGDSFGVCYYGIKELV